VVTRTGARRATLIASAVVLGCSSPPPANPGPPAPAPAPPADAAAPTAEPQAEAAAAISQAVPPADAGPPDAGRQCSPAVAFVPYVIDLGPSDNSPVAGAHGDKDVFRGPPIRATMTELAAPAAMDASAFVTYLPFYVAEAYQRAVDKRRTLHGTVRVTLVLDGAGAASRIRVVAPGFPAAFVDEVRARAASTYELCEPLGAAAGVRMTMTLRPRTVGQRGRN